MPTQPPRPWTKTALDIVWAVAIVIVAKTAVAEPYYVPSGSMEPTLQIGDQLLATKFAYGYSSASLPLSIAIPQTGRIMASLPQRGDVVVFRYPGNRSDFWVKRVIGLPGDRIALNDGQVSINGTAAPLRRDGVGQVEFEDGTEATAAKFIETLPGNREHPIVKLSVNGAYDNMAEITVPADHLFVMGDNRDNSADSRIPLAEGGVGLLPIDNVVGRADAIVGSWDLAAKSKPVWTWPSALRLSRFFTSVH
ncbi:MAG: signal peptidase I [Xanthobacteraceae bacterium]